MKRLWRGERLWLYTYRLEGFFLLVTLAHYITDPMYIMYTQFLSRLPKDGGARLFALGNQQKEASQKHII
jgi:hypothetical protein